MLGFAIEARAGILMLISSGVFGVLFFWFTKIRYKKIAEISEQIDLVLHNVENLNFNQFEEGELSILYSEITKMMLRIREQNEALIREKRHLADSLADISHQLRTPLTSATLILSLLANNPDENERKIFVREIKELLLQMDWLITSLLKLSRFDSGMINFQNEKIDVYDLIEASLRPFQIPIEIRAIDVSMDISKDALINGDFNWLSEAIQNIFKNCLETMDEDGKLEIVCVDTVLFTEIEIHDSGVGFEKEDLPYLFDRFYRGKKANHSGYGIGLALAKMIINRQGGIITAKNHPEGGALFRVRFSK